MSAFAIPAMKGLRTVKQPDGTELQIRLVGDEFFSYTTTADGVPVVKNKEGFYVYANVEKGVSIPTAMVAHNANLRNDTEIQLVSVLKTKQVAPSLTVQTIRELNNADNQRRAQQMRKTGAQNAIQGQKHCLIILVQYTDKEMVHSQAEFQEMASAHNYSKNNHIGSLSDFFYDQSYGKLSVNFDVVGPYTLDHEMSYYGAHSEDANDVLAGEMISEAVHKAHNAGVNFSKYDWTGNGFVDQVFVIYAGYAEAQGGEDDTIWPHKWSLNSAKYFNRGGNGSIKYDGVTIDTYACSSELRGYRGTSICGIGTAAHEFSHCLGLPDLYDTTYSGGTGMSDWSLMDGGGYRADGDIPTPYTAQERAYIGWIDLIELDKPMKVTNLPSIIEQPVAYVIYNEGNRNEYYVLENHQKTLSGTTYHNWDQSAAGHGMLVTHVDFNASAWASNSVNDNPSHQRCIFIGADGRTSASSGSLYPGTRNNTSLTNTSTPAATTYNANTDGKKLMNRPIESISEQNGLINFIFDGGVYVPAPTAKEATDVTSTGFTANWEAVAEAESYTLEVTEKGDASTLFYEDFAENNNFSVTKDGTEDISSKLNDYLSYSGWTGKKLFVSAGKIKLGESTTAGSLVSPYFKAPKDGFVKIELGVKKVSLSTAKVIVSIVDANGAVLAEETITPDNQRHTLEFSDVTKKFYVKFATDKNRAYIDFMAGYAEQDNSDALWTSLGTGKVSDMYMFKEENIPCEFFKHKEHPYLYRISNPYVKMLEGYANTPSPDASDYLYVQLLQKGDQVLDNEIDRDDLVLFYGDYDHDSFNTGYTHSNYNDDVCLVYPGIFTKYPNVDDWAQSRVLSKYSDGSPKRVHLAPFYYMWNNGGWDATQKSEDIIYLDFPEAKTNAPQSYVPSKPKANTLKAIEVKDMQTISKISKPMLAPGQKKLIENLKSTSYTLTDLSENAVYSYRVKTVNEEGESKWSNSVEVDLSTATGITSIPVSSLCNGEIFDLFGRQVNKMEHGVYIQNGKKVLK